MLCLDVEPRIVESLTRPVVDAGYAVLRDTRANAARCLAGAAVVLADLRVPGPALPPLEGRPLVALLAKGTPEPAGAVETLIEPDGPDEVLAAVDRALARHRLALVTESLEAPLRSLAAAVREAEAAYDANDRAGAGAQIERIRSALEVLEARVAELEEE